MKKIISGIVAIDLIISLYLGVSNVLGNIKNIPIEYLYISLIVLFLSFFAYLLYILLHKPWTGKTRPYFLKFSLKNNFFKQMVLRYNEHPLFNYIYHVPKVDVNNNTSSAAERDDFTKKVTIIIEDDPVGFKHDYCIPGYFIDETMSYLEIESLLKDDLEELLSFGIFFVTTPSRKIDSHLVVSLYDNIGHAIKSLFTAVDYRIVSKVDSCLRSNIEFEYKGLSQYLCPFDYEFLVPAYVEEGRTVCYGTAYISSPAEVNQLLHTTEYAEVEELSYKNSNLSLWLEEKSKGRLKRQSSTLIDVDRIRSRDAAKNAEFIAKIKHGAVVFDTVETGDISRVLDIFINLERTTDKRVLYKLGPSLINGLIELYANKITVEPSVAEETSKFNSGILVAGSLSSKSKKQVELLRNDSESALVLISNEELLDARNLASKIDEKYNLISKKAKKNRVVVLTTEFWVEENTQYPNAELRDKALDFFSCLSNKIYKEVDWLIFKGSDTAYSCIVDGMKIKKFYYTGHICDGVNRLKLRFPDKKDQFFYTVGGNVGAENILLDSVSLLSSSAVKSL